MAGFSLGVDFYSYKGARAFVPVWSLLTVVYLLFHSWARFRRSFRRTLVDIAFFTLAIFPFLAMIPFLEVKYAGAVFDRQRPVLTSVYDFLYPYFSSFDPTFLFIKGDATLYHSTQRHGMMLLASLPLFLIGGYQAIKKRGFWLLILISFFSAPLLYGLVNSVHRASRLMTLIPSYVLLGALGGIWLWDQRDWWRGKLLLVIIIILMVGNYFDFANYYWFTYPKFTESLFGDLKIYHSYEVLAREAETRHLTPYITTAIYQANGESGRFFEAIYFDVPPAKILPSQPLPPGSLLLTNRLEVPGMEKLEIPLGYYFLQVKRR